MEFKLKNTRFLPHGIYGELWQVNPDENVDNHFICCTLQHSYSEDEFTYEPKLPSGVYDCVKGTHKLSNLISFTTFEVMDVPNCTGILFHIGNHQDDSHGCILLGEKLNLMDKAIINSKVAFDRFMQLTQDENVITLIVE